MAKVSKLLVVENWKFLRRSDTLRLVWYWEVSSFCEREFESFVLSDLLPMSLTAGPGVVRDGGGFGTAHLSEGLAIEETIVRWGMKWSISWGPKFIAYNLNFLQLWTQKHRRGEKNKSNMGQET